CFLARAQTRCHASRTLVTGGSGFIGQYLVTTLLQRSCCRCHLLSIRGQRAIFVPSATQTTRREFTHSSSVRRMVTTINQLHFSGFPPFGRIRQFGFVLPRRVF